MFRSLAVLSLVAATAVFAQPTMHSPSTARAPKALTAAPWVEVVSAPRLISPTPLKVKRRADWKRIDVKVEKSARFAHPTVTADNAPDLPVAATVLWEKTGDGTRVRLYDVEQKKALYEAGFVSLTKGPAPIVITAESYKAQRKDYFDLATGQKLDPVVTLPGGRRASSWQMLPRITQIGHDKDASFVVVRGVGETGTVYAGVVPDSALRGPISLTVQMPFDFDRVLGRVATMPSPHAWSIFQRRHGIKGGASSGAGEDCPLVSFDPTHGALCRPPPRGMSSSDLIDGRYRKQDHQIYDDVDHRRIRLGAYCDGRNLIVGHRADPVGVLSGCSVGDKYVFELWSETGSIKFEANASFSRGLQIRRPVAALDFAKPGERSRRGQHIELWVDLERGRVFTGGDVHPLMFSSAFGVYRHALGTHRERPAELWHIDLDRGVAERIAKDHGCPKPPRFAAYGRDCMLYECVPTENDFVTGAKKREATRWVEVVDFKARKRYRVQGLTLSTLTGMSKVVVGTSKSDDRQIVYAKLP